MKITKNKKRFNELHASDDKFSIELFLSENSLGCFELVSDKLIRRLEKL